jgi:hypothetical protein
MMCVCGCGQEFEPKRPWQKFFSKRCRNRFYNRGVAYRKPRRRAGAHDNALKAHSVDDGSLPLPEGLYEANGEFSRARPPANLAGEMSKTALRNPRLVIRLAEAVRRDEESGRPLCRTCWHNCADGETCRRIEEFRRAEKPEEVFA